MLGKNKSQNITYAEKIQQHSVSNGYTQMTTQMTTLLLTFGMAGLLKISQEVGPPVRTGVLPKKHRSRTRLYKYILDLSYYLVASG